MKGEDKFDLADRNWWLDRGIALQYQLEECKEKQASEGLLVLLQGCMDICNKRLAEYEAMERTTGDDLMKRFSELIRDMKQW